MEEDVANIVIKTLRAYLREELPLDKGFFSELDGQDLLASDTARELAQLADHGKRDCVWNLVIYMEEFYTEEMLLRLCVFLEEYAQPARHKLAVIASRIRQEISKHKPQLPSPVPKDPLHRSAGAAQDDVGVQPLLYPVITPLKQKFSELVAKVFVVISKLKRERMEELHSYLTTLLTDVRQSRLPIVPKPVDELKEFLRVKWDELNIQVLESIVDHLKDDKLTKMMTKYQQTLSKEETTSLGECSTESVQIVVTPEETLVPITIDQNPDQQTLGNVFSLCNFFHTLRIVPAIFRGFKRGCTVLFFSIPTECVWSLPASCLLPSNLSLLEEWKVLFFSVKGAFTVDIKERRVIASLDNELSGVRATFLKSFVPAIADSSSNDAKSEVANKAKSRTDSATLLRYKSHFVKHLHSLGAVLGVKENASAVLATQASLATKYIQITDMWMERTPNPTWDKFCSCLSQCDDFTCVRTLIEQEQLQKHGEECGDGSSSSRVLPNTGSSTSSGLRHRIQTTRLNTEYDEDDDHGDDGGDDGYQQPQPSQQRGQRGAYPKSARCGRSCSWGVGLLLLTAALMVAGGGACTWSGLTCAAADCVAGAPQYCPSLYLQFLCNYRHGDSSQEIPVVDSDCPGTTQPDQEENTKPTTVSSTPSRSSDSDETTSVPTLDEKEQVPEPTPQPSPTESQTDSHSDSKTDSHSDSKTLEQTNLTLTGEEVDQLEQFKRVKEGSVIWMEVGVTGAGKSCLGNFILGQDDSFAESSIMAISETDKAALKCSSLAFDSENLCVIDTPGLGDTGNVGSFTSDAEDVAYDYSKLATELTKVMMMMDQGINAFLIVAQGNTRDYRGLQALLEFCDIIGAYWNHSILVVTHGKEFGNTEEEQYATYREKVLAHPKCPAQLKKLLDKVSDRLVIAEPKDWRNRPEYHRCVVGKITKYSKEITEQHGPFKDELQSIGREAYEKAKLELRNEFEDMNSFDAQAAVFQSTFKHVRDVVYRLVRIKMADGEDVDKIKKMAKVKEEELDKVRNQRDTLHEEYLEEQLRRKEAEKKQRQEEEKRKQAEERQRQEEEARKQAERRLEEYLKKDTFKDRRVTARVYRSGFYRWEWVHSAEAIDEGTGTTAKAQNYAGRGGALEHAKLNLKAVLLEKGIIRKDD